MASLKNISPVGDLDVPGVGTVPAGGQFDCPDELAASLLRQEDNFAPVKKGKADS